MNQILNLGFDYLKTIKMNIKFFISALILASLMIVQDTMARGGGHGGHGGHGGGGHGGGHGGGRSPGGRPRSGYGV